MTEDEMAGWHHRLDGHGFGWTGGLGCGQGDLACCGSWAHKELDTTEQVNCLTDVLMFQCLDLTLSTSLVAQRLKHLSAMQETWVRSLGWEDPLEKEMTTHSSILA